MRCECGHAADGGPKLSGASLLGKLRVSPHAKQSRLSSEGNCWRGMMMVEPITTGGLVAAALGAAAGTLANGALGAAAKDAYEALKAAVIRATGESHDVAKLEAKPDSSHRASALAETIDDNASASSAELKALAEALAKALEREGQQQVVEKHVNVVAHDYGTAAGRDVNIKFGTFMPDKKTTSF